MDNKELTEIYNKANKLDTTRHNPITTERIFTAMRGAMDVEREACARECEVMLPILDMQRERDSHECAAAIRERSNVELRGDALLRRPS